MVTHYTTDFTEVLDKLREYYTLSNIADISGMSSHGHVADLHSGRKKSVGYDAGVRLMAEYNRILKSEARKAAK